MKFLTTLANFFKGTYAKFGTKANLFRELSLSVLTALAVAVLVQLLTPSTASPIVEVRALATDLLSAQHRADSILALPKVWALQHRIDSLESVIQSHNEKDSILANADLSDLDAMRRINSAIDAGRQRSGQRTGPK